MSALNIPVGNIGDANLRDVVMRLNKWSSGDDIDIAGGDGIRVSYSKGKYTITNTLPYDPPTDDDDDDDDAGDDESEEEKPYCNALSDDSASRDRGYEESEHQDAGGECISADANGLSGDDCSFGG